MSALLDAAVLERLGLNPKDERYTRGDTHTWWLGQLQLKRFTLDVCGCPESRLARRWFGLQLDFSFVDGLARPWSGDAGGNIPFTQCERWVAKAWREWERGRCRSISLLVPNDKTEQDWWLYWVAARRDRRGSPLRLLEVPGRVRFSGPGLAGEPIPNEDGRPGSPFFGCYLLAWHPAHLRGSPLVQPAVPKRCT